MIEKKYKAIKKNIILSFLAFLSLFSSLSAQSRENPVIVKTADLVEITSLKPHSTNILLREYEEIVQENYKAHMAGRPLENAFFKYRVSEKFNLQELCARCNINYDTITTVNSISSKDDSISGRTLLLPSFQGLFIPLDRGQTAIEVLLQENYKNQNLTKDTLYYKIDGRDFVFLQGKRFSPTERAFYLDSSLMLPLAPENFYVSSEFGKRKNPLSGQIKNHNGIDLAAAEGTPVYAVKDGDVACAIEADSTFGNYIILSHDLGKQTSVYAHLSKICVSQYQFVKKGTVIGFVGHTGLATGDHLHFEIRQGGKALNPREKITF